MLDYIRSMDTNNNGTFRYLEDSSWFKGNTHTHTTASDGGLPVDEVALRYASSGHDFTFITDHMCPSAEWAENRSHPVAVFDGVELHGNDSRGSFYHVVCLGTVTGITGDTPFEAAMEACRDQGALMILAHPAWTGNSLEDTDAFGFHGVEVYNNICRFLNGKDSGAVYWDRMLENNPNTIGFACDDAHLTPQYPVWNGGWIMAQAEECKQDSILASLKSGRFYATRGPEIYSMKVSNNTLHVKTSPVQIAWLAGERFHGTRIAAEFGKELTEFSIQLPDDFSFVRLELEDDAGKRAWTNTLFSATEEVR
jgi:hypothetical protein